MSEPQAYVFRADLVGHRGVSRTIALAGTQTLALLHTLLRAGFGWEDDHLYAFWLDGEFWGDQGQCYEAPFELEESGGQSAEVAIGTLELSVGQKIAYVFDFGDEWRVLLTVADVRPAGAESYPQILESTGEAPPQYPDIDE